MTLSFLVLMLTVVGRLEILTPADLVTVAASLNWDHWEIVLMMTGQEEPGNRKNIIEKYLEIKDRDMRQTPVTD